MPIPLFSREFSTWNSSSLWSDYGWTQRLTEMIDLPHARVGYHRMFVFKFLQIVRSTLETSELRSIDPYSSSILSFVGESETEGRKLRVSDIVARREFGSPPTVYSRIQLLEEADLLVRLSDADDRRSKSVHLTPRARKIYQRMSANLKRLLITRGSAC